MLAIEYRVHIRQVSPRQLSCGDTCQIWMRFKGWNRYFCEIENFVYGEIDERSFSNPHPRCLGAKCATTLKHKSFHNSKLAVAGCTGYVIRTTFGAVNDDKFGIVTTLGFHWINTKTSVSRHCRGWVKMGMHKETFYSWMVQYLSNGVNNRGLLNYSLMYFLVSMVSTRLADARWKIRSRVSRVPMSTNVMSACDHGNITPGLVSESHDDVISWKLLSRIGHRWIPLTKGE